jgi:hypothetical protein
MYIGGFVAGYAFFSRGLGFTNIYQTKFSTSTRSAVGDLGASPVITPQLDALSFKEKNNTLGGKPFNFTSQAFSEVLQTTRIPVNIQDTDSSMFQILGLGKPEDDSPLLWGLYDNYITSDAFKYARFKRGFNDYVASLVEKKILMTGRTDAEYIRAVSAQAQDWGVRSLRTNRGFTRNVISHTQDLYLDFDISEIAGVAMEIPLTFLA